MLNIKAKFKVTNEQQITSDTWKAGAFINFTSEHVLMCGGVQMRNKYSRECFNDRPAFLANKIHRSICPAFKNQCFSATASEEDGGVCPKWETKKSLLCCFLYEVRLRDVTMVPIHVTITH